MIKKLSLVIPIGLLFSGLLATTPAVAQNSLVPGYEPNVFDSQGQGRGIGSYKTLEDQCSNFPGHKSVVCPGIAEFQNRANEQFKPPLEPPRVAELISIETLTGSSSAIEAGKALDPNTSGADDFFNTFAAPTGESGGSTGDNIFVPR